MKRICNNCKLNKVNLFAYLYGLRHCEQCENDTLDNLINIKKLELQERGMEALSQ